MKKSLVLILSLLLTACATSATHKAAPQNYRLKGDETTLTITGALTHDSKIVTDAFNVNIFIDEKPHLNIALDKQLNGEGDGLPYKGKKTSASCTGKFLSANSAEVRCMVFIDNERTVTLTF